MRRSLFSDSLSCVFYFRKKENIWKNKTSKRQNEKDFGIVTYIPTDNFRKGKNELRTVKLETPAGEIYEELVIPFWFSKY